MRYFCTLFDSNYLAKGVAMLRSLHSFCPNARVYVLCMDDAVWEFLDRLAMPEVCCVSLTEIEDEALLAVKPGRSLAEYCWTLSPCLLWHLLERYPAIDLITYLDADLYFYSPIQPLFDEIDGASIAIIEHRFVPRLQHLEVKGRFCVEWVSFRRDVEGMACLKRWREQCIEWCFYRFEADRMGDQKYLDKWPQQYGNLHILQHPGAGVAPWNYTRYHYGRDAGGRISVDGEPLIFYHFHQFQLLSNGGFDRLSAYYSQSGPVPSAIYAVYEKRIRSVMTDLRRIQPGFAGGVHPFLRVKVHRLVQRFAFERLKRLMKKFVRAV